MLPKYLDNKSNIYIFNDEGIYENSQNQELTNKFSFGDELTLYFYLDNFSNKDNISINIQENANINLFFISESTRLTEINLNVTLANNAKLTFFSNFISKRKTKININRNFAVSKNAKLKLINTLIFKGSLNMNDIINLNSETAEVSLDLLNIGSQTDAYNINQDILHNAKSTKSVINNSLISNNLSKLKYSVSGRIFKGNEKSTCSQLNRGVILNKEGYILVEPKLFIDEYDVEANHGAAIGQIDDDQLFYLLSRGLTEAEARSLIISGYTNPFVQMIEDEPIQEYVIKQVNRKIKEANK